MDALTNASTAPSPTPAPIRATDSHIPSVISADAMFDIPIVSNPPAHPRRISPRLTIREVANDAAVAAKSSPDAIKPIAKGENFTSGPTDPTHIGITKSPE